MSFGFSIHSNSISRLCKVHICFSNEALRFGIKRIELPHITSALVSATIMITSQINAREFF